jgi:hypothetical protein
MISSPSRSTASSIFEARVRLVQPASPSLGARQLVTDQLRDKNDVSSCLGPGPEPSTEAGNTSHRLTANPAEYFLLFGMTLLHGHYRLLDSVRDNGIKSDVREGGILQQ